MSLTNVAVAKIDNRVFLFGMIYLLLIGMKHDFFYSFQGEREKKDGQIQFLNLIKQARTGQLLVLLTLKEQIMLFL